MSIFGGSARFPQEHARSPGPVYGRAEVTPRGRTVVMKADHHPVDETRRWGKRESWIGVGAAGSISPHMPLVSKECQRAPGQYDTNVQAVKVRAPQVSFPKSSRFLSQKVNVTDQAHQRELMAADSPGPKYNVSTLAANGGRSSTPRFSFAPRSPGSKPNLPNVNGSPGRGHRESWLSVINRDGILVMPTSSTLARPDAASPVQPERPSVQANDTNSKKDKDSAAASPNAKSNQVGSVFGSEHRFGMREEKARTPQRAPGAHRIQFVSSQHTRENMGEFSPGPIYSPHSPECPGGRLAPSPSSGRRPRPPGSPSDDKNPHASLNSRSSWLAGNVHKSDGLETVMMQMGDIPPGPGSYRDPKSSFATFSHNTKVQRNAQNRSSPPRAQRTAAHSQSSSTSAPAASSSPSKSTAPDAALRAPEPTAAGMDTLATRVV